MSDVNATLNQRETIYGDFRVLATMAQWLRSEMRTTPNWLALAPDQKEALDMIAAKLARILCGDQDHFDSWHDIAGYAQLIARRLGTPPTEAASEDRP